MPIRLKCPAKATVAQPSKWPLEELYKPMPGHADADQCRNPNAKDVLGLSVILLVYTTKYVSLALSPLCIALEVVFAGRFKKECLHLLHRDGAITISVHSLENATQLTFSYVACAIGVQIINQVVDI